MSLDHILLSHLAEPATGYDLKTEFEAGAATFWPAHPSQIYATLDRLESRGLLESTTEPSDRGPDRRVYTRTERGSEELRRWIAEGPDVGRQRLAYPGQLTALGQFHDRALAHDFLSALRGHFAGGLAYLEAIEPALLDGRDPVEVDEATFYDWAGLHMGLEGLRSRVRCCDELLALLGDRARREGDAVGTPAGQRGDAGDGDGVSLGSGAGAGDGA